MLLIMIHGLKNSNKESILKGIVIYFNNNKEYGFINSHEHNEKIHFNLSDWQNAKKPTKGDKVQFQTRRTKNNTLAAQHIVIER